MFAKLWDLHGCRERADAASRQKRTADGLVTTVGQAEKALHADNEMCKDLVSSLTIPAKPTPCHECAYAAQSPRAICLSCCSRLAKERACRAACPSPCPQAGDVQLIALVACPHD